MTNIVIKIIRPFYTITKVINVELPYEEVLIDYDARSYENGFETIIGNKCTFSIVETKHMYHKFVTIVNYRKHDDSYKVTIHWNSIIVGLISLLLFASIIILSLL